MEPPLPLPVEANILDDLRAYLPQYATDRVHFEPHLQSCAVLRDLERGALFQSPLLQGSCSFSTEGGPIVFPAQLRLGVKGAAKQLSASICISVGVALALLNPDEERCTVYTSRVECHKRDPKDGTLHWQWAYAVIIYEK